MVAVTSANANVAQDLARIQRMQQEMAQAQAQAAQRSQPAAAAANWATASACVAPVSTKPATSCDVPEATGKSPARSHSDAAPAGVPPAPTAVEPPSPAAPLQGDAASAKAVAPATGEQPARSRSGLIQFEPAPSDTSADAAAGVASAERSASPTLVAPSQADPSDWMGQSIDPDTPLSRLTLPGTHDSGATLPDFGTQTWQAQHMSIKEQLEAGVRSIDLRLSLPPDWIPRFGSDQPDWQKLRVDHGGVPQGQSGQQALGDIADFLREHPGEAVVVSIKKEGGGNDRQFQKAVEELYEHVQQEHPSAGGQPLIYGGEGVPTLGEAQGQIVLMRRYAVPDASTGPRGIDATVDWPDNANTATASTAGGELHVSDHYDIRGPERFETKWTETERALDHSLGEPEPDALHVTFGSATSKDLMEFFAGVNPRDPDSGPIEAFSNYINPRLQGYAQAHQGQGGVGIVAVDHADPALIRALIAMNR